jgi:hypothetical protein
VDRYKCIKCGYIKSFYREYWSPNSDSIHTFEMYYDHEDAKGFGAKRLHKFEVKIAEPSSSVKINATHCLGCGSILTNPF